MLAKGASVTEALCRPSFDRDACAGNRRKEQNIVKKSVGFNWGPSAVSTTYWTGFRLCDLLKHCGAKGPLEGARYVHFKGVEKELPQVR